MHSNANNAHTHARWGKFAGRGIRNEVEVSYLSKRRWTGERQTEESPKTPNFSLLEQVTPVDVMDSTNVKKKKNEWEAPRDGVQCHDAIGPFVASRLGMGLASRPRFVEVKDMLAPAISRIRPVQPGVLVWSVRTH